MTDGPQPRYLTAQGPAYQRALAVAEDVIRTHAARGETVTYGEINEAIEAETGEKVGYSLPGMLLDDLNERTWNRTGVAMSAVVVNAETGKPGPGFLKLLERHGLDVGSDDDAGAVAEEQQRVFEWARTNQRFDRLTPEDGDQARRLAEENRRRNREG